MDRFLKSKKIRTRFRENIEPQEIFLDNLAQKRETELGFTETKFEVPLSRSILMGLEIVFVLLIIVFFVITFRLQVLQNEQFQALADENRQRIILIRPERGIIYDKQLKKLVLNNPSFDLILDKRDLPKNETEKNKVLETIAEIFKKNPENLNSNPNTKPENGKTLPSLGEIKRMIDESKSNGVLILENIPHYILVLLESKINELTSFRIEQNITRNYQNAELFSHVMGYMGRINEDEVKIFTDYSINDYIGKNGIEKSYEQFLRGTPGKIEIEKDSLGNTIFEKEVSSPETGKSLVLWLDSDLQQKIKTELVKSLKKVGSKSGGAVAIDPKTGGVLAMFSIPSYDNNLFLDTVNEDKLIKVLNDPENPLFNRMAAGSYPTGSTIKPLIASAALQENIISPQRQIFDEGFIEIPHEYDPKIIYNYKDWAAHGMVDIRKAIAVSCNVYFYTVGGGYKDIKGLGLERIKKYLGLFGWGTKTGIDLPEDQAGLVPDAEWKEKNLNEPWYIGNTYHLSIGQGYLRISPLQVATAYAAIANGGKLFEPHVAQRIINNDGSTVQEIQSKIIRENFIDPDNLKIVREGMRGGVTYGSSVILNDLPVKVAAKTGTAQTQKAGTAHSWITVFAPYDDPQIVLTIIAEDVEEGQVAVLPVAKEVLNWYFSK